jgi:uncharacterized protein
MAFSLFDASVVNFVQTLEAVNLFLEKARIYLEGNGQDPDDIVERRLYTDMRPFRFQIVSVAHHSRGALEGIGKGLFSPEMGRPDLTYQALQQIIRDAHDVLVRTPRDTVNAMIGLPVLFKAGDLELPFAAEDFLMSLSLPNFYFHATTAYDILRNNGVPLGKRDFLGQMRIRRA